MAFSRPGKTMSLIDRSYRYYGFFYFTWYRELPGV